MHLGAQRLECELGDRTKHGLRVTATPGVSVGQGTRGGGGTVQIETPGETFTVTVTVLALANAEVTSRSMTITKGPDGFAFGGCDSVRDVQQLFSDA